MRTVRLLVILTVGLLPIAGCDSATLNNVDTNSHSTSQNGIFKEEDPTDREVEQLDPDDFIIDVTSPKYFSSCINHDDHGAENDWSELVPGLKVGRNEPIAAEVVQWFSSEDRDNSASPNWEMVSRSEDFSLISKDRYAIAEATLVGFTERPDPNKSEPIFVNTLGSDNKREGFSNCNTAFSVDIPDTVRYLVVTVSYDFEPGSPLRADDLLMSSYFLKFK